MRAFRDAYLADAKDKPLRILDLGSAAIAGHVTYRDLFAAWDYVGLDAEAGVNVDLVLGDPYHWSEVADASADVVVSGQTFEHIEWPWLTIMEVARVLKPNGLAAITAPSSGHVHRYPRDSWRYYPDAFPALARYAGLAVIENEVDFSYAFRECAFWGDAFTILQKPAQSADTARDWARRRHAARVAAGLADEPGPDTALVGPAAPFQPEMASRDALARRTEQEQAAVEGMSWRWWLARQHLRAVSRAFRYPARRLKRF